MNFWKKIPHPFQAICFGFIGYLFHWYSLVAALILPREGHGAHVVAQLIASFELGLFFYIAYISVPMIGMGWALIVVLAYYQKRLICIGSLAIIAIHAYWMTSDSIGHAVTIEEVEAGISYFLRTGDGLIFFTFPLALMLFLITWLLFRPFTPSTGSNSSILERSGRISKERSQQNK